MNFDFDIVKPPELGDTIYIEIKEAILSGQIQPGTMLVQQDIAERLRVSRTPVRDALERLAQEDLVIRSTGGRTYVAELSIGDLREKYQVRQSLEGLATRLTAENLTEADLDRLNQILTKMDEAVEREDQALVARIGSQFHSIIIAACGNELLGRLLEELNIGIRRYRSAAVDIPGRTIESLHEHEKIYNALVERNGEEAAKYMQEHIAASQQVLERAVLNSKVVSRDRV